MSDAQQTDQSVYSKRHRVGVAKKLNLILAEIEDLRTSVHAVLAERQSEQNSSNHGDHR